jgi:hypothetical protein
MDRMGAFLSLVVFLLIPVAQAVFTDVSHSTPYASSIEQLRIRGTVQGYADGTFRPGNHINRAEFTKIIVGIDEPVDRMLTCPTEDLPFPDVPADAWYAPYLCVAWKHDWIRGYPDGTFGASKTINFAEAAKITLGGYFDNSYMEEHPPEGPWYQPYFEKLRELDALPSSYRSPSQLITRGEMAEMIVRVESHTMDEEEESAPAMFLRYHNAFDFDDRWYRSSGKTSTYGDWDAELVVSDAEGERIVVPSIKKVLPELKGFHSLMQFSEIEGGPTVFVDVVMESGSPWGDFYVFDTEKATFRKLSVSSIPRAHWPYALSGNGRYLAVIESTTDFNPRKIYTFDLLQDTVVKTLTLAANERLTCRHGPDAVFDGYSNPNLNWFGDRVEYTTFPASNPQCSDVGGTRSFFIIPGSE